MNVSVRKYTMSKRAKVRGKNEAKKEGGQQEHQWHKFEVESIPYVPVAGSQVISRQYETIAARGSAYRNIPPCGAPGGLGTSPGSIPLPACFSEYNPLGNYSRLLGPSSEARRVSDMHDPLPCG